MPKVVDHEERRAELAAAVWRLASREGLEAITVRRVAEEAGWSTGALVHYFAGKEELLLFAFRTGADRVGRRLEELDEHETDPLARARAQLLEGLPLDRDRQDEVRVWFSFLGLALTRPALARAQRVAYRAWRDRIRDRLLEAQEAGQIRAEVDCPTEAAALVGLVDGLAVQATFEPRVLSAARQVELVDARLDELRDVVASIAVTTARETATIEPLRFEDGALLVLDQRALPDEERWIRCETPEQVADCIRTLAVRGAPAIGLAAAYAMALADDREAAAELLRSTRPTAVNLAWALEQCRGAADPLETARRLHREQHEADRKLAELGAELFGDGHPGAHALQHRRARHRRLRHGLRRAARGLGARPAGGGVGGRDAPAPPGRAADRLGAPEGRHPAPRGRRLGGRLADGPGSRRPRGGGRGPHRGERRRGEQGRHLPARGARGPPRRALLRGRAGVDDRSGDAGRRRDPDRGARPRARCSPAATPSTPPST